MRREGGVDVFQIFKQHVVKEPLKDVLGCFPLSGKKQLGNLMEFSGNFPGNFREVSGKYPEISKEILRKISGTSYEPFTKLSGTSQGLRLSGKAVGDLAFRVLGL